jgi:hypothetical protein
VGAGITTSLSPGSLRNDGRLLQYEHGCFEEMPNRPELAYSSESPAQNQFGLPRACKSSAEVLPVLAKMKSAAADTGELNVNKAPVLLTNILDRPSTQPND